MRATLLLAALSVSSCAKVVDAEKASGKVTVEGWKRPWSLDVAHCRPVRVNGRPGIILYGNEEALSAQRLTVAEGEPPEVEVAFASEGEILTAQTCSAYEVDVHETGKAYNDTDLVSGRLKIDCVSAGRARITAEATFADCY